MKGLSQEKTLRRCRCDCNDIVLVFEDIMRQTAPRRGEARRVNASAHPAKEQRDAKNAKDGGPAKEPVG